MTLWAQFTSVQEIYTFSRYPVTAHATFMPRPFLQEGEQWCKLEQVKHGQLLLRLMLNEERSERVRWSHLDEASRQLLGEGKGEV